jgi:transcriptional regulator with XRE-family HTH domain
LPFCYFTLKASRTAIRFRNLVHKGFILKPETLGQHLRSRRLALNLTQAQVAQHLNTLREQYDRWERDGVAPEVSMWPRLIRFLGYYPTHCQSPADWILRARRTLGLTQFALGRKVSIIAENIREWEHGKAEPPPDLLTRFQEMGRVA